MFLQQDTSTDSVSTDLISMDLIHSEYGGAI